MKTAGWMAHLSSKWSQWLRRKRNSLRIVGAMLRLVPAEAVVIAVLAAVLAPTASFAQGSETCPGGGYNPVPVEVTVDAVPIVVSSTTDDYFVLYVNHEVDGTAVEYPVLVARGEAGTTTLAEKHRGVARGTLPGRAVRSRHSGRCGRRLYRRPHRTRQPGEPEPGQPGRLHRQQRRRPGHSRSGHLRDARR